MEQDGGVEYLLRSDNRTAVLELLAADGPLVRSALEERLTASRRTVSRVLTELIEHGYVRESGTEYRLTRFGEAVVEAYRRCKERTDLATQYRPFLANVDSSAVDFDLQCLEGADLTVASDIAPYAPLDRMLELRRSASRIRAVTPLIEKKSLDQFVDRVESDETVTFELVLPANLYEFLRSEQQYSEQFATVAADPSVEIFVFPDGLPMLYAVVDDVAALGASADGKPHALVESTDPELRDWVTQRIAEYRAEGIPSEAYGK